MYRPPSSPVAYWNQLEASVDQIAHTSNAQPLLVGDFNVNVLDPPNSPQFTNLKDMCNSLGLRNVITTPTRLPSNSCLDLALVPKLLPAGVTLANTAVQSMNGVTDHCLISIQLRLASTTPYRPLLWHKTARKPPIHKLDPAKFGPDFVRSIQAKSTDDLTLNELTEFWTAAVHETLDKHCPLQTVSLTTHPQPPPWFTPELTQLLRQRKHLHRQWLKHRDERSRQAFRAARRSGTLLSRRLRAKYYTRQFLEFRRNPRAHWQVLNRLLGRNKLRQPLPVDTQSLTAVFSQQVSDPSRPIHIALPSGPQPETGFVGFKPVTVEQESYLLKKLNVWKSNGSDGIPASLLNRNVEYLASSLQSIFNESLNTGVFPSTLQGGPYLPCV